MREKANKPRKPKPQVTPVYTDLIDGTKRQVGTATVYEHHVEYAITDPEAIALIKDDSFNYSLEGETK